MMTQLASACWKSSSGETTLPEPFDCTSSTSPHSPNFHRFPDQLGAEDIRHYQLFLIQEKKLAWSSYKQIVCALRFFYVKTLKRAFLLQDIPFPRKEQRLPLILSREEVARILTAPPHLKSRALTCES